MKQNKKAAERLVSSAFVGLNCKGKRAGLYTGISYICYKQIIMEIEIIRQKLHQLIDALEDKKAEAMFALFEDEIEQESDEYTDEFKAELNKRYEYYINGGKMISAEEAEKRINAVLQVHK